MTERLDLRGQETEHTEQTADRREADRKLEGCDATVKKTTQGSFNYQMRIYLSFL